MSDAPETPVRHYPVAADIPCGLRFAQQDPPEGWGRISKIAQDSVELETYFTLVPEERVFLTFAIEQLHQFSDVPAKVAGVRPGSGYTRAEIVLDEGPHRARLKEAMIFLVDRT